MHLLRMLAEAGCELRYHGDFDWGGIRIGNVIFGRLRARPWRFDTADYRAAADRGRRSRRAARGSRLGQRSARRDAPRTAGQSRRNMSSTTC